MRKRKQRKKKSGWIYVFQKNVPRARDHYKIGKTTYSVEAALARAITGSSYELSILASYRVRNVHTAEKMLHEKFTRKNIVGGGKEWFRLNRIDLTLIPFLLIGE